jgi:cytochrome b
MRGSESSRIAPVIELRVWDPVLRLLHWSLAASVIGAWLLGDWLHQPDHQWHEWLGYTALAVALLRIVWGAVGPRHARFASFVRGPLATWRYARAVWVHREARYLGHNPLGAWMVLALLLNVLVTAGSGWLGTTDAYWGVEWVQETHAWAGQLFVPLVLLHLAGVAFTARRHREKLVRAMVTGRKPAPGPQDID